MSSQCAARYDTYLNVSTVGPGINLVRNIAIKTIYPILLMNFVVYVDKVKQRCSSRQFVWGCKGYFARISPNLAKKTFKRSHDKRSHYKFSIAVGTSTMLA